MTTYVYIAQSLDGYIADRNNGVDWLNEIPNPDGSDFGFADFITGIDALVMGRKTFEVVQGFGGEWPYPVPVYVVSTTLTELPVQYKGKVTLINMPTQKIITMLADQGLHNLYIDGGTLIQSFLRKDLIDEMIITTVPVLLGGGASLFGELAEPLHFTLKSSEILVENLVKTHWIRTRS